MSADNFYRPGAGYWPLRLLRCKGDRFKSIERSGQSTYEDVDSPPYNILSYTWGRWEKRFPGQTLPIYNVSWRIPAVKPEGFSVESFARVVQRVSQGAHVWLDVGCIDQEDEPVKMREIGKQADIFRRAGAAYIWLSHSKRNVLAPLIRLLLDRNALSVTGPWLNTIRPAVHLLFSDPWFSSLWTLQEGFLRPNAVILFDDASTLNIPAFESMSREGGPCTLFDLVSGCEKIRGQISFLLGHDTSHLGNQGVNVAREIVQRLDDVGVRCIAFNHAISLYGVSSLRNPRREEDRIYEIMQVYGFVLGKSADTSSNPSLRDLEDQMGQALNEACPVTSQMFLHLGDPRPYRRWCINNNTRVTSSGREAQQPTTHCRVTFDASQPYHQRYATFSGHKARFGDVASRCEEDIISRHKFPSFQVLYFDNTTENKTKLPATYFQAWPRLERRAQEVGEALAQSFGPETSILLIGELDGGVKQQWYNWLGVIAYPFQGHGGRTYWGRIGICTWSSSLDCMNEHLEWLFKKDNIYLG